MTLRDGFPRLLSGWLAEEGALTSRDYLDEVLARTSTTRQRPAWMSPWRWLPMDVIMTRNPFRLAANGRLVLLAALVLVLVAALAIVLIGAPPARPSPFGPAGNGRIVFELNGSIVLANADGSASATVALGGMAASTPTFSRDGSQLAYYVEDPLTRRGALHVANPDGTGARPISGDLILTIDPVAAPLWSPDGRQILFYAQVGGFESLVLANTDGSAPKVLVTRSEVLPAFPAWSPDGRWIAYAGYAIDQTPPNIQLISADGAEKRVLVPAAPGLTVIQDLTWAPDDSGRIAYVIGDDAASRIEIIDLAGRAITTIERPGVFLFGPSWSPDAKQLASNHSDVGSIVVNADGSDLRVLPEARCAGAVPWSPDGTRLLCLNSVQLGNGVYELLVIDPTGVAPPAGIAIGGEISGQSAAVFSWQRVAPTTP